MANVINSIVYSSPTQDSMIAHESDNDPMKVSILEALPHKVNKTV